MGSQTGSPHRQTSGHTRRQRAMVSAARLPISPHPATSSDAAYAPEKRKAGGSIPPLTTSFAMQSADLASDGEPSVRLPPPGAICAEAAHGTQSTPAEKAVSTAIHRERPGWARGECRPGIGLLRRARNPCGAVSARQRPPCRVGAAAYRFPSVVGGAQIGPFGPLNTVPVGVSAAAAWPPGRAGCGRSMGVSYPLSGALVRQRLLVGRI